MPSTIRTIAWIGDHHLRHALPEQGFDVRRVYLEPDEVLVWKSILLRAGCEPDCVVYADQSQPPPVVGLELFPCPTVFYCVDSHVHSWYPVYAQAFDGCAVSLKDHLPRFRGRLTEERLLWLPPAPRDIDVPRQGDERWDLLFVGHVNPETTPGRVAFLKRLGLLAPGLHVAQGDFRELYAHARLVLNVAERGDLNFRVFEALACGKCLLTPSVGHGQAELFQDGVHLFTYPGDDAEAAASLAKRLLADEATRRQVAAQGFAEIERAHRLRHRAEQFATWLRALPGQGLVEDRIARAEAIHGHNLKLLYLHWAAQTGNETAAARYLAAATYYDRLRTARPAM